MFVKKKDGSWRPVIDYRGLNSITIKNRYPLPLIPNLIDQLLGTQWFTKFDVRNGYNDIKVTFHIDADASPAEIEALVAQSQKRSAVFEPSRRARHDTRSPNARTEFDLAFVHA